MTSQADFYIIDAQYEQERIDFLCRLVEKAWQRQLRIYIHTGTEEQARLVDETLWYFKPQSFLPHCFNQNQPREKLCKFPVVIGMNGIRFQHDDLLINISSELPSFFNEFDRYAEITHQQAEALQYSRDHYRQLNQQKIPIKHHDLRRK